MLHRLDIGRSFLAPFGLGRLGRKCGEHRGRDGNWRTALISASVRAATVTLARALDDRVLVYENPEVAGSTVIPLAASPENADLSCNPKRLQVCFREATFQCPMPGMGAKLNVRSFAWWRFGVT